MTDKQKFREEVIQTIAKAQKLMEESEDAKTKALMRRIIAGCYKTLRILEND